MLLENWVGTFTVFSVATLGGAQLSRRGFLPLHVSALVGAGAYSFAYCCSKEHSLLPSAACAIACTVGVSVLSGLLFSRVRLINAALVSIALQIIFDQYVRVAKWTGGTSGLWAGLPSLPRSGKLVVFLSAVAFAVCAAWLFSRTAASRVIVADGQQVRFAVAGFLPNRRLSAIVTGVVTGGICACAGIVLAIQQQFVSPEYFGLTPALLYVAVVLLVGFESIGSILLASAVFSLFPEILRQVGLGDTAASSWRGVVVGVVVALIVVLQLPRPLEQGK